MRLIDADDFLSLFYSASAGQDKEFIKTVEMVVEDTPTIDAEPVRHGKWMYHRISVPKGKGQTYSVYGCWLCHAHVRKRTPYCPNCGANMQGDEDAAE